MVWLGLVGKQEIHCTFDYGNFFKLWKLFSKMMLRTEWRTLCLLNATNNWLCVKISDLIKNWELDFWKSASDHDFPPFFMCVATDSIPCMLPSSAHGSGVVFVLQLPLCWKQCMAGYDSQYMLFFEEKPVNGDWSFLFSSNTCWGERSDALIKHCMFFWNKVYDVKTKATGSSQNRFSKDQSRAIGNVSPSWNIRWWSRRLKKPP